MKNKIWYILSVPMFLTAANMLYNGFDKMTNYYNPEYGSPVNAYVGADAYNYIINGNYATGFFVLATLFTIAGFCCIVLGYLHQANILQQQLCMHQNQNIINEK